MRLFPSRMEFAVSLNKTREPLCIELQRVFFFIVFEQKNKPAEFLRRIAILAKLFGITRVENLTLRQSLHHFIAEQFSEIAGIFMLVGNLAPFEYNIVGNLR